MLFEDTSVYTESLGETDSIENLSQHFDQALNFGEQPQSTPFNHHQPLPPLSPITMSNAPTSRTSELHLRQPDNFDGSSKVLG